MENAGLVGSVAEVYSRPRRELLEWLQNDFECSIAKIEQCCTGALYVQILDKVFPGKVPMSRVVWNATQEYEMTKNYKLLQEIFKDCHLNRAFDISKLTRAKHQDNLEFLQWLKFVYDKKVEHLDQPDTYRAYERRLLGRGPIPDWAQPPRGYKHVPSALSSNEGFGSEGSHGGSLGGTAHGGSHAGSHGGSLGGAHGGTHFRAASGRNGPTIRKQPSATGQQPLRPPVSATPPNAANTVALQARVAELTRTVARLESELDGVKATRDFYHNKLFNVEQLCANAEEGWVEVKYVTEILVCESMVQIELASESEPDSDGDCVEDSHSTLQHHHPSTTLAPSAMRVKT